jgi:hypothetical protein
MTRPADAVLVAFLICAPLLASKPVRAEQVAVGYTEGLIHGFLALRTLDGDTIAEGDLSQTNHGDRVTTRLTFHFKDGSLHEETAIYSQRRVFQLLKYHLIEKGPTFQHPMETSIDVAAGQVTVRTTDDDGKEKMISQHMNLPLDLANGLTLTLLKNVRPRSTPTKLSMVAATPKPRLVKLAITAQGEEPFSTAGTARKAMHYVVKIEIGGAAGLIAPIIGKEPPDIHVWILLGDAPAFVKSEGPLYYGGPIWRIELASPVWPKPPGGNSKDDHPRDEHPKEEHPNDEHPSDDHIQN